jgi:hypothetical protein
MKFQTHDNLKIESGRTATASRSLDGTGRAGYAEERLAAIFYKLKLNEKNKLEWHGIIDGQPVVKTKEPDTSIFKRFSAWFQKIVPESQL